MSLTKITNPSGGFPHRVNEVLMGKCQIYIAKGEIDTDPETPQELQTLITTSFVPLGDMDATGSNVTWSEKTVETDFSTLGVGFEVTGTFISVTVNEKMLSFASNLGHSGYSFLFMPEGATDTYFALSGVTVTTEGNLGVVEDGLSKITFKVNRKVNKLTDCVKFARLNA